jgi:AcrR family transcriptional regulator
VDAAERVLLEEGYAAVTSRRIAAVAGVHAPLVHYYFLTLDDLLAEVFRRGAERSMERLAAVFSGPEPLQAFWQFTTDPAVALMMTELMAAANHREVLRDVVAELSEQAMRIEVEALGRLLDEYGIDSDRFPPELVAATLQGLGLLVSRQRMLQLNGGQEPAVEAAERYLRQLEEQRARRAPFAGGQSPSTRGGSARRGAARDR